MSKKYTIFYKICTVYSKLIRILSQFYLGEDYLLGNAGFLCADKFFPFVRNIDDCRRSFSTIKLKYPDAKNKVEPSELGHGDRPKGCFFHIPRKSLYWNPHKTGKANKDDRQVCKAKGKVKNLRLH